MKSFPVAGGRSVSLALYSDVSNSRVLLDLMQSGKLEPEVAFLNASLVPDVFPVLAAAHKALLSKARESLTTRTLHSELVYNYSGSKHITESLKRCGISDDTTYILAARFDASNEENGRIITEVTITSWQMKAVEKLISGTEIDLGKLESRANQPHILKHYKIPPQELLISTLPDAIVCRIAARDAL
ncbi:EKC/KEOPS complex subunit TPRKB-like isoform X1 [Panicum virgatum]|uniref:EKC/KEOPS complex subunit TPRKB-like isoform X1 n=1 Tax=Panicum virgatum TaxID=38727 RepID=UPI0019D58600|nr:EKC/KEOPS complex subunit TPRKB-like isoform X1 [Panicum virgatum]